MKKSTFKCDVCKDTSWVSVGGAFKRCACYEMELMARRWIRFGVDIKEIKLINTYKADNETQREAKRKAISYIKEFEEIRKTRNNSMALLGQAGAGKTHLALAIGKALLERKEHVGVVYMPYLEVMRELKSNSMDDEFYLKIQDKYITCELLIVDDLFKDKVKKGKLIGELKETDMKHIYPIINQRYVSHRPTIYSSECNAEMLMDLDEALGGRILESCKDNTVVFKNCDENNHRFNR